MEEDEKSTNQINMAPLVDISLTLVLVFLVTMPLSMIHGITVKRQGIEKYGLTIPTENVIFHLTKRGVYFEDSLRNKKHIPYEKVGVVLRQMIQVSKNKDVYLYVGRDVPHGQTVWALDISKQNGADNISIFEGER